MENALDLIREAIDSDWDWDHYDSAMYAILTEAQRIFLMNNNLSLEMLCRCDYPEELYDDIIEIIYKPMNSLIDREFWTEE